MAAAVGPANGVKNFDIVYRIDGVERQCEHNENMLIYSFVKYGMRAMTRGNRIILENARQLPTRRSNSSANICAATSGDRIFLRKMAPNRHTDKLIRIQNETKSTQLSRAENKLNINSICRLIGMADHFLNGLFYEKLIYFIYITNRPICLALSSMRRRHRRRPSAVDVVVRLLFVSRMCVGPKGGRASLVEII